jgi:hypothetical protein
MSEQSRKAAHISESDPRRAELDIMLQLSAAHELRDRSVPEIAFGLPTPLPGGLASVITARGKREEGMRR